MTTRLEPIDEPVGLLPRLAHWMCRRRLGKVIMPMRTLYPRLPGLYRLSFTLMRFEEKGLRLDPATRTLVKAFVADLNGCAFCLDLTRAQAPADPRLRAQLAALDDWRDAPAFDDATRAMLAFAESAAREVHVKDAVYAEARHHFDERSLVEIAWLVALESYYNRLTGAFALESDGFCAVAPG